MVPQGEDDIKRMETRKKGHQGRLILGRWVLLLRPSAFLVAIYMLLKEVQNW
jgi:hypothetical protein